MSSVSFFDSLIQQTNPIADAVFGKSFALVWQGQTIDPFRAILSAHPIAMDDDGHNVLETAHSHNFEISAAAIVFGGRQMLPVPGMQIVERLYGLLEIHHDEQAEVRRAGEAILAEIGKTEVDRIQPEILSSTVIRG